MKFHLNQHLRKRREETLSYYMMRYEKSVGFIDGTESESLDPNNDVTAQQEAQPPTDSLRLIILNNLTINARQDSREETTINDQWFFKIIKKICVDRHGEIQGMGNFDVLLEAYDADIENNTDIEDLAERRRIAQQNTLDRLSELDQNTKEHSKKLTREDLHLATQCLISLSTIAGIVTHWVKVIYLYFQPK